MTTPGMSPTTSAAPTADVSPVRAAIGAANAAFMTAFGRADAAALASCYTSDAQLLPAQSDAVSGRAAIEGFWNGALGMGLTGAKLETAEVYHADGASVATEVGRYTLFAGGDQVADRGKYVVIWQQGGDGQWRLHRDIWTTSQAPAASA